VVGGYDHRALAHYWCLRRAPHAWEYLDETAPVSSDFGRSLPTHTAVLITVVLIPEERAVRLQCVNRSRSRGENRPEPSPSCADLLRSVPGILSIQITSVPVPEEFARWFHRVDHAFARREHMYKILPARTHNHGA
jgi:hypothetical protein